MEKQNKKLCSHPEERRQFLKSAGLLLGGGIALTSMSSIFCSCENDQFVYVAPPPPTTLNVDLSKYSVLSAPGGVIIDKFSFTDDNGTTYNKTLAIKRETLTEFVIVDAICSHLGQVPVIAPVSPGGYLSCPAHAAEFGISKDNAGLVTANPNNVSPLTALTTFESTFDSSKNILSIFIK
ncbi:MAG: Rieske protein [Bacteroidota bacterium]|nr:Rieske protein [Bacteroidota bacterium]